MRNSLKTYLFAACAIAGFGCTDAPKPQVLTGRVAIPGAVAVRAIDGTVIVTAARVRSDGSFTLHLPPRHHYRLEVLTAHGVHNVVGSKAGTLADVAFTVCQPEDPFDMGGVAEGGTGTDAPCESTDPGCMPPPCDPTFENCPPNPPPSCDPSDPDCGQMPPPCDPTFDTCEPPPPPPCPDPSDPSCGQMEPGCDPTVDATCPTQPPPCPDPTDGSCMDPCVTDPASCGCGGQTMPPTPDPDTTSTSDDTTCWPPPEPCTMESCTEDPWQPEYPPRDFGCDDEDGQGGDTGSGGTSVPDGDPTQGQGGSR